VIGTRGSALALRQTAIVAAALQELRPGLVIETRPLRTEGDERPDVSLAAIGGEGVFVKAIERALLAGSIDLAVHSLKDMPATLPDGLTIGAVPARGDIRDALVGHGGATLADLPTAARVGTDSRRRAVQLVALRPDLRPVSLRGNVETRLSKAETGALDAVVLAAAGLERLGLPARATQIFEPNEMLPAVGQGALAAETRAGDTEINDLLRGIDDQATRVAVTAERAYLRRLGAGCRLPVAAYGTVEAGQLKLRALLADDDGRVYRDELAGATEDAETLGAALAAALQAKAGVEVTP
jgi:hydroxymethylbilane synthase